MEQGSHTENPAAQRTSEDGTATNPSKKMKRFAGSEKQGNEPLGILEIFSQRHRMTIERRHNARPEVLNLLDYLVVDEQGRQGDYSMARTLNISKGGILMETHKPLPKGQQVMITLGLDNQLIDVMGRIVYATSSSGRHQTGIEFFHVSDSDKRILDNYVTAFHKLYARETANHPMPIAGG